jgi:hypothetical protein
VPNLFYGGKMDNKTDDNGVPGMGTYNADTK